MLRVILVDDEPVILNKLKSTLQDNVNIEVVGAYTDPMEVLQDISHIVADCAFLDIEMPGLNGIELAEQLLSLNPEMEIVFVTAHNHYAAQAFDVNAIDYLLKPIRPERLNRAVDRFLKKTGRKPEHPEKGCKIWCFGMFEVMVDNSTVKWSRSRAKEVLAYLLQHEGRWLSKYRLCEELWTDYSPEQALSYLQICLHSLRKTLREAGCTQITIDYSNDRYSVTVGDAFWDKREFQEKYEVFHRTGSKEAAEQALRCYRGEYLEGEDWLWSDLSREEYICKCDRMRMAAAEHMAAGR